MIVIIINYVHAECKNCTHITEEEEDEAMEVKKEEFEAFIRWLKMDGLVPKKSERLWRKAIYINLKNDEQKTIDNYIDFMKYINRQKSPKKEEPKIGIDDFDYSIVIGQSVQTSQDNKTILRYVKTEGFIHLFYDDKTDEIVNKDAIQKRFKKSLYS